MGFDGLRVLSLESRRSVEMAKLITNHGGVATVAPSMREVPLESNTEALDFARRLFDGEFEVVIFLTGVGTRALARVVETAHPRDRFLEALRSVIVVARGPKPVAVLREFGVPIAVTAPEPNTWRELMQALAALPLDGRRVAVQEYGVSNPELLAALAARGAAVTAVPVYQWGLPEDLDPIRAAARDLAAGRFDVVLFTTSVQLEHLFRVAAGLGLEDAVHQALCRTVVASIGPTTSEALHDRGLTPDLEPTHPKMGFLVQETAGQAAALLARKPAEPPFRQVK